MSEQAGTALRSLSEALGKTWTTTEVLEYSGVEVVAGSDKKKLLEEARDLVVSYGLSGLVDNTELVIPKKSKRVAKNSIARWKVPPRDKSLLFIYGNLRADMLCPKPVEGELWNLTGFHLTNAGGDEPIVYRTQASSDATVKGTVYELDPKQEAAFKKFFTQISFGETEQVTVWGSQNPVTPVNMRVATYIWPGITGGVDDDAMEDFIIRGGDWWKYRHVTKEWKGLSKTINDFRDFIQVWSLKCVKHD